MDYFIVQPYSPFALQVSTFGSQLTNALAASLGFTIAERDAAIADGEYMTWVVTCDNISEKHAHEWKHYMHQVRFGDPANPLVTSLVAPTLPVFPAVPTTVVDLKIQDRFAKNAAKAKASVNYTTTIGQKLGIEAAAAVPVVPADAKPKIDVITNGGFPEIHLIKGHFHAANLYKDSGNGFGTVPFKTMTTTHFLDTSPLPAANVTQLLKYKAIYLLKDVEVGHLSDVISVAVEGK